MLETFSRTLVELYDSAESLDIKHYPAEVVRLVGKLVRFDGAVLGLGESSSADSHNLIIHNAFVHGRAPGILCEYAQISSVDPMTHRFMAGLPEPLAYSLANIEPGGCMAELRAFYKSHELQHLLLFGDTGGDQHSARWLVLYRGTGDAFDSQDRQNVAALWPHLARSSSINRSRFLGRQLSQHQHKGVALISSSSCIEAAEPLFRTLCALEWPSGIGRKMPDVVWKSWRRGLDYVGARVKFKMHLRHDDFIVSEACAIGLLDLLTPAERVVASRFGAGLSAKAIGRELGISVNTVRSQLTHVYGKLDIHDKAGLAVCLLAYKEY